MRCRRAARGTCRAALSGPVRRLRRAWPVVLCAAALACAIVAWSRRGAAGRAPGQPDRPDWVSVRLSKGQREYVDRRGVHVVVGHYMGGAAAVSANLTPELLDANNFRPQEDAGRDGRPVVIPPQELAEMQRQFQINRFNLLASDRIPLNRSLPDVRKRRCLATAAATDERLLPNASVVIVFHNEAWSTLLRTVWSVIERSPRHLLHEIVLVDDASERAFLREPLDAYAATLPVPVHVVRARARVGLVRARTLGARRARGQVLAFLDAHCECTPGWLPALLARVAQDRTRVACPVIDIISDDTFAYVKSFELHWGALNWQLHFRWYTMGGEQLRARRADAVQPFTTPAMAGGLFAIDRSYFWQLGGYDAGMRVWGGENLEMSFRVWQCGGSVEIVPCSHVGHLFRKSSPYSFPGGVADTLHANLARVALVWMDEWAAFYFRFNERARAAAAAQDVAARTLLRRRLRCRPFAWYLRTVWPQHFFPTDERFFGRVRHVLRDRCLARPQGRGSLNQPMGAARLALCLPHDSLVQMFVMDAAGAIMTDESVCLDAPARAAATGAVQVRILACSGFDRQRWTHDARTGQLVHVASGRCLDAPAAGARDEDALIVANCSSASRSQRWSLERLDWK